MKAISLWQPYACLVAAGEKANETRSWPTSYRGPLAIHATKTMPPEAKYLCREEPFRTVLARIPDQYGPLVGGAVLAVADLVDCRRIDIRFRAHVIAHGLVNEMDFGDYTTGRYAWVLSGVRRFVQPYPARGKQGLWDWTFDRTVRWQS